MEWLLRVQVERSAGPTIRRTSAWAFPHFTPAEGCCHHGAGLGPFSSRLCCVQNPACLLGIVLHMAQAVEEFRLILLFLGPPFLLPIAVRVVLTEGFLSLSFSFSLHHPAISPRLTPFFSDFAQQLSMI